MYTIVEGFDKVGKTTFIQGGKGGVQGKRTFGPNGQIIVNDGTNDRVLIGFLG